MKAIAFLGPTNYQPTTYVHAGREFTTHLFAESLPCFYPELDQVLAFVTPTVQRHGNLVQLQERLGDLLHRGPQPPPALRPVGQDVGPGGARGRCTAGVHRVIRASARRFLHKKTGRKMMLNPKPRPRMGPEWGLHKNCFWGILCEKERKCTLTDSSKGNSVSSRPPLAKIEPGASRHPLRCGVVRTSFRYFVRTPP